MEGARPTTSGTPLAIVSSSDAGEEATSARGTAKSAAAVGVRGRVGVDAGVPEDAVEFRAIRAKLHRRVLESLRVDDVREGKLGRDRHSRALLRLRRLPRVDDRVLPPRADDERPERGARRPVAV